MRLTWKPGDRAVLCYRPLPSGLIWDTDSLAVVGHMGTVMSYSYEVLSFVRIGFHVDGESRTRDPLVMLLAPPLNDPYRHIQKGVTICPSTSSPKSRIPSST
jgi:hypothetical protein